MSGAPSHIPTQEYVAWLEKEGIHDQWDRDFIIAAANELDHVYVEYHLDQMDKEHRKSKAKAKVR